MFKFSLMDFQNRYFSLGIFFGPNKDQKYRSAQFSRFVVHRIQTNKHAFTEIITCMEENSYSLYRLTIYLV